MGASAESAEHGPSAPSAGDDVLDLRHVLPHHLFQAQHDRLGTLDARADRELRDDIHLALIGLRQQFGRQQGIDHGGGDD